MSVVEVLLRAKLRISAHGHRQGRAERPQGRRSNPAFLGYSLEDAVLGLKIAGEDRTPTQDETAALQLVAEAVRALYPDEGPPDWSDLIEAFNDAPGRRKSEVMNVLERAKNLAAMALAPQPEGIPIISNQELPGTSGVVPEAPATSVMDVPTETATDINGPSLSEPEQGAEIIAFHPLDHDKDGHKGGSVPASDRGLHALFAEAEALGIDVDHRWGVQTLLDHIHEAKVKLPPPPLPPALAANVPGSDAKDE